MKPIKRGQRRARPSRPPTNKPRQEKHDSSSEKNRPRQRREFGALISIWFVLSIAMLLLAKENLSVPGLYYDEAIFTGLAKDFLTGHIHGPHMPGCDVIQIFGRPFPIFVQSYLGALKSWMLMPSFRLFGHSVAVLRSSNLFWGLISLLFFILGTWRWLGVRIALIAGSLLALDPTYFFQCVLDWGSAVPSFLCRCLSFYLMVLWWRRRQTPYAFLAAFFAGLGFFNKIDFALLLIGVVVAGCLCFRRALLAMLRSSASATILAAVGFLLGVGPMFFKLPGILTSSGTISSAPGEFGEKLHTMSALYDGSYFYRLMNVGGIFGRMFSEPVHWLPIFGGCVVVASIACVAKNWWKASDVSGMRVGLFLVLSAVLVTLGVFLLPGAVRIHHAVLIYPLPHLIIAVATGASWETLSAIPKRRALQATICIALLALLAGQLLAIRRTQDLIRETGGRGRWSESFVTFCRENRDRTDLTIVSLDWGFNEQLVFLTEGPQLVEPFWRFGQNAPSLPTEPRYLFLVYPPEYSLFPFGVGYLKEAQAKGAEADIRPYFDRQGRVAFYTIQFLRR